MYPGPPNSTLVGVAGGMAGGVAEGVALLEDDVGLLRDTDEGGSSAQLLQLLRPHVRAGGA